MDSTGWKIYFWILVVLTGIGTIYLLVTTPTLTPRDILQLSGEILALIGLYSFVFNKETFQQLFWKYYFWIWIVADTILAFFYRFTALRDNPTMQLLYKSSYDDASNFIGWLIGIILYIPLIYAIYRLGYPQKKIKPKRKSKSYLRMVKSS